MVSKKDETLYEKSKRIKGYGFEDYEEKDFKKKLENNPSYTLESNR